MNSRMSVLQYAAHRRCSERAVRKAIAEHRIEATRDGNRWLIDPVEADQQWDQNTDPSRGGGRFQARPMPDTATAQATESVDPIERAVCDVIGQLLDQKIEIDPDNLPMLSTALLLPLLALGVDAEQDPDPLRRRIRLAIADTVRRAVDLEAANS